MRKNRYSTSVEERLKKPRKMAVKFAVLGGGDTSQLTFSDSMQRADKETLGPNWIRTSSNIPGGGGNGITAFAQISTNDAALSTINGVGPTQAYQISWIPLPVYFNVYNLTGYFIQYEFRSITTSSIGAALRYNHDMNNSVTQTEGADYYVMIHNGRIDKVVGGGAQVVIGAATWAPVLGDTLRFECLTVGAQVNLQTIRNGVILQTISDATATRILTGGPAMQVNSMASAVSTVRWRNFSCGPISRLS